MVGDTLEELATKAPPKSRVWRCDEDPVQNLFLCRGLRQFPPSHAAVFRIALIGSDA